MGYLEFSFPKLVLCFFSLSFLVLFCLSLLITTPPPLINKRFNKDWSTFKGFPLAGIEKRSVTTLNDDPGELRILPVGLIIGILTCLIFSTLLTVALVYIMKIEVGRGFIFR